MLIIFTKIEDKILKATGEKQPNTYKGIPIRLPADFPAETLWDRRKCLYTFRVMKEKKKKRNYSQEYSTQQGSHSQSVEKSKALKTGKS